MFSYLFISFTIAFHRGYCPKNYKDVATDNFLQQNAQFHIVSSKFSLARTRPGSFCYSQTQQRSLGIFRDIKMSCVVLIKYSNVCRVNFGNLVISGRHVSGSWFNYHVATKCLGSSTIFVRLDKSNTNQIRCFLSIIKNTEFFVSHLVVRIFLFYTIFILLPKFR